jgi:hypothetical protein
MRRYKRKFDEMAKSSDFKSGFLKDKGSIELVRALKAGEETFELEDGRVFSFKRKINALSLKKGMLVVGAYNSYNQGADLYEIIGFTDDSSAYGENPSKIFRSIKELFMFYNVKSLKQLEVLQSTNEYGYHTYLIVRDVERNVRGPWFYPYEGRWCRGSGAEPLTFIEVQEI